MKNLLNIIASAALILTLFIGTGKEVACQKSSFILSSADSVFIDSVLIKVDITNKEATFINDSSIILELIRITDSLVYKQHEMRYRLACMNLFKHPNLSERILNECIAISNRTNNLRIKCNSILKKASIYGSTNDHFKHNELVKEAYAISHNLTDSLQKATIYFHMSTVFNAGGGTDSLSSHYLEKAFLALENQPESDSLKRLLWNFENYKFARIKHDVKSNITKQHELLDRAKKNNFHTYLHLTYLKLGRLYMNDKKVDSGIIYYTLALNDPFYSSFIPYHEALPTSQILAGYVKNQDVPNSTIWFEKLSALKIPKTHRSRYYQEHFLYYYHYQISKDYKQALTHYEQTVSILEEGSVQKGKMDLDLIKIENQAESANHQVLLAKKEQEIIEHKATLSKYMLVIALILIGFIVVTYLFIQSKRRIIQQNKITQLDQKLIRAQMNPHFISNSITGIQSFLYNSDTTKAMIYFNRFSKLMDLIIDNSRNEYISIDNEIKTIKYYLELQQLRLGDRFSFNIQIDHKLNKGNYKIPPMLIQPFIESAIEEHAFNTGDKSHINIEFKLVNDIVTLKFENNGVAKNNSAYLDQLYDKESKQNSADLTAERIAILNQAKRRKIEYNVSENVVKDEVCGTQVEFKIPYKLVS